MKTYLTAAGALLGLAVLTGTALAGPGRVIDSKDAKMSPAVEPTCNWTGFYIGAHVGYGGGNLLWRDADVDGTEVGNEVFTAHDHDGVIAGGQLGYNYQVNSSLVLGLEGDFSWSDMSGDAATSPTDEPNTFNTDTNWTATIAARVGFTSFNNRLLTYVKGGAAIVDTDFHLTHDESANEGNIDHFDAGNTEVAPMIGFGLEYAINCHWSAKLEYRHVFLGSYDISGTNIDSGTAEPETYRIDQDLDSVVVGINYKF
jgi:opacity protein-like surface antigen